MLTLPDIRHCIIPNSTCARRMPVNGSLGPLRQEAGSALILAMLVAGLVAAMAVQFAQGFVIKASLAEQRVLQQRMDSYLRGAEEMAMVALIQDGESDITRYGAAIDHLQELWALSMPPLSTDDGFVEIRVRDAQGLFNVNNLAVKTAYFEDTGASRALRFSTQQKQFIRLLQALPGDAVSEQNAVQMTEALVDWLDEDDQVSGSGGAESLYYSSGRPQRYPPNQGLHDISELIMVRHFSPELLAALQPYVTALPVMTPLNVNTAPGLVLSAVNGQHVLAASDSTAVADLLKHRQQQPFSDVADFLESGYPVDPPSDEEDTVPAFGVSSGFFHVYARVQIAEQTRTLSTLIRRDESGTRTISRVFGSDLDDQFSNGASIL